MPRLSPALLVVLAMCTAMFSMCIHPSRAAAEYAVGVSPPIIDLGDVDAGETRIVKFFIVTPSTEPLLVYLEGERGSIDFFTSKPRYTPLLANLSEEPVVGWLEFLKNPTELRPQNKSVGIPSGQLAGWQEVSFLLNVPKDAEPGIHLFKITPYPSTPSENLGPVGARMVAVTAITIIFNVPGRALRDGVILDSTAGKFTQSNLEINTYFRNTGSDTVSVKAVQEVFVNGSWVSNLTSAVDIAKPGETRLLKTYLDRRLIPKGVVLESAEVRTNADYTTGFASMTSPIRFGASSFETSGESPQFPWWILAAMAIIGITTYFIYKWSK
jgi:hypothetical protein